MSVSYYNMRRPPLHKPCDTVTSFDGQIGTAGVCHPHVPRRFSVAELKRIFGFPDDYVFTGTYRDIVGRLGNSVPPPLAHAVAAKVYDQIAAC